MNILITLDYELYFGEDSGTPSNCMIKPTNMLLDTLDRYGVKASFFVDSGYLIKLDEFRKKYNVLDQDYAKIARQLEKLCKYGHDVQLHVHPHWEDSYFDGERWKIVTNRFRLHDFNRQEIDEIIRAYKNELENFTNNTIFAFRAGGWCIQPFSKIKDALINNGIWLDSTLFNHGYSNNNKHYVDFRGMPKKDLYKFSSDPLFEDNNGYFTELPISSFKRPFYFMWVFVFTRLFGGERHKKSKGLPISFDNKTNKLIKLFIPAYDVVSMDGYKSSQLQRAFGLYLNKKKENFVIIGHPKAFSSYSIEKIDSFIKCKLKSCDFLTYKSMFN